MAYNSTLALLSSLKSILTIRANSQQLRTRSEILSSRLRVYGATNREKLSVKNKGLQEEIVTKIGLYDLAKFHAPGIQ